MHTRHWRYMIWAAASLVAVILLGGQPQTPVVQAQRAGLDGHSAQVQTVTGTAYACDHTAPCSTRTYNSSHSLIHAGGEARTGPDGIMTLHTDEAGFYLAHSATIRFREASDWATWLQVQVGRITAAKDSQGRIIVGAGPARIEGTDTIFSVEVLGDQPGNQSVHVAVATNGGCLTVTVLNASGQDVDTKPLNAGSEVTIPVGAQGVPAANKLSTATANAFAQVITDVNNAPDATVHYFAETGHVVGGQFWQYWQQHGGLYQQGLPISDRQVEPSQLDPGKSYTTQYFERAVFELHPENAGHPESVLLTQLGTYRYQTRYPHGAPGEHADTVAGHYFPETGHWVGGQFWQYWQQHGGLAQQGLPLSDEFMEKSDLDVGKSYLVQYFERAVFEYHPENAGTAFEVELAQLGTYRWHDQHGLQAQQTGGCAAPPPKLALAFFYPWYGPNSFAGDPGIHMSDAPILPYISDHPDVLARQISEAQGAGIDGFISTWFGDGDVTAANFPSVLAAVNAYNTQSASQDPFQTTVYFEIDSMKQRGDIEKQIQEVITNYSSDPAFLHWTGKPVFFFWKPEAYGNAAAWVKLRNRLDPQHTQIWSVDTVDVGQNYYLDAFDSLHLFSAAQWQANTDVAAQDARFRAEIDAYNHAHLVNRLWTAGVIPGWDERLAPNHPDHKFFARNNGALYNASWYAAIQSSPDWVTITSYNEWFEGSQIEPSSTYGNLYLTLTQKWIQCYKSGLTCLPPS
jgi:hypothetical protein